MSFVVSDYLHWNNQLVLLEGDNLVRYQVRLYGHDSGKTFNVQMVVDPIDTIYLDEYKGQFFIKAYDDSELARRGVYVQTGLQNQGYGADSSIAIAQLLGQRILDKTKQWFDNAGINIILDNDNWLDYRRDNLTVVVSDPYGVRGPHYMGIREYKRSLK